jgi:hypothetical protein
MTRIIVTVAGALAALALAACGSHGGRASAEASSLAANPTASAAASAASVAGEKAANECAKALGGTPGQGASALVEPAVLRQLVHKDGRHTCLAAAVPDPSKRAAAEACLSDAAKVFLIHPGAIAGDSSGSVDRRHTAEASALTCLETATA